MPGEKLRLSDTGAHMTGYHHLFILLGPYSGADFTVAIQPFQSAFAPGLKLLVSGRRKL
ncbi:MAG: hypothetical protein ACOX8W_00625 [bacterium]